MDVGFEEWIGSASTRCPRGEKTARHSRSGGIGMLACSHMAVNSLTRREVGNYTRAIVPTAHTSQPLVRHSLLRAFSLVIAPSALLVVVLGILFLAETGCSDRQKPAPFGLGTVDSSRTDVDVSALLVSPPVFDNHAETIVGAGDATTLYAGFFGPRRMRTLIRFAPLPTSRTVVSATVHLHVTGAAGDSVPLTVAAHRLLADWGETTTDETNVPAFDASPAATDTASPATGDSLLISLPSTVVQAWADTSGVNFGLLLVGAEANVLRKFAARTAVNDTLRPFLELVTTDLLGGSMTTEKILADRDAYVAQPDTASTAVAARLLFGKENGVARRAGLEFEIPAEVDSLSTVNSARLELALDTTAFRLAGSSVVVSVHEVISSIDTSAVVFRTQAEGTQTISADSESLSVAVTGLVAQERVAGRRSIRLLVRTQVETADTDLIAAASAEGAAGALFAPRLRLIVSRPEFAGKRAGAPATTVVGER